MKVRTLTFISSFYYLYFIKLLLVFFGISLVVIVWLARESEIVREM